MTTEAKKLNENHPASNENVECCFLGHLVLNLSDKLLDYTHAHTPRYITAVH